MASPAIEYARGNQQRFLNELKDLLRIPSISTLQEHKADVQKAADLWPLTCAASASKMSRSFRPRAIRWFTPIGFMLPGKPTALCYAHYDVQPPEPLDEWTTPPFEPTERNNNIYARGAVDDKGQLWMQVKAIEVADARPATASCRSMCEFIFEGEEEVGGEVHCGLRAQAKNRKAQGRFCAGLRHRTVCSRSSDAVRWTARTGLHRDSKRRVRRPICTPACMAARRRIRFSALIEIISKLKDAKGKILIPGLLQEREGPQRRTESLEAPALQRRAISQDRSRFDGADRRAGYSVLYRTWARPTLEVHGMPGGFVAPGAKTVIPAQSLGKSFHAPGAEPGSRRHPQEVQGLCEEAHAQGHSDQHQGLEQAARRAWWARTTNTSRALPRRCTRSSRKTPSSSAPAARFRS